MDGNMTPADFSALMGNNANGFGGNWWIIVLFLFLMNGGNWNRGEYGQYATAASQQEILYGQQFQNLDNKIDRVGNGIADLGYALQGTITNEGRSLQNQMSQIGCDLKTAIHAEGEATRGLIQANEIQTLRDKVAALEADSRMCGVVRYPMAYTYAAPGNPFCNANNGCCNGGNI